MESLTRNMIAEFPFLTLLKVLQEFSIGKTYPIRSR